MVENIGELLPDGTYRIMSSDDFRRAGRIYFDPMTGVLKYMADGQQSATSVEPDPVIYADLISYITILGANSSFTVSNGKLTDVVIRFSNIVQKLNKNTIALTAESFAGAGLTLHANNVNGSNAAGDLAKNGSSVELSDTVKAFNVSLDGDMIMGDSTNEGFVRLNGASVVVDPAVEAGAAAIIGADNGDGTYRTFTFLNGGDGSFSVTFNTSNTLSLTASAVFLEGTFNNWDTTDTFEKTGNKDILTVTKDISQGVYEFRIHKSGSEEYYGNSGTITDSAERMAMSVSASSCTFIAEGGKAVTRHCNDADG